MEELQDELEDTQVALDVARKKERVAMENVERLKKEVRSMKTQAKASAALKSKIRSLEAELERVHGEALDARRRGDAASGDKKTLEERRVGMEEMMQAEKNALAKRESDYLKQLKELTEENMTMQEQVLSLKKKTAELRQRTYGDKRSAERGRRRSMEEMSSLEAQCVFRISTVWWLRTQITCWVEQACGVHELTSRQPQTQNAQTCVSQNPTARQNGRV